MLIISICLGDAVFPTITITAMIMLGIITYRNRHTAMTVKTIKTDSSVIAFAKNFGFPIGMPIIPAITMELKITTMTF